MAVRKQKKESFGIEFLRKIGAKMNKVMSLDGDDEINVEEEDEKTIKQAIENGAKLIGMNPETDSFDEVLAKTDRKNLGTEVWGFLEKEGYIDDIIEKLHDEEEKEPEAEEVEEAKAEAEAEAEIEAKAEAEIEKVKEEKSAKAEKKKEPAKKETAKKSKPVKAGGKKREPSEKKASAKKQKIARVLNAFGFSVGSQRDFFVKELEKKPMTMGEIKKCDWNTEKNTFYKTWKVITAKHPDAFIDENNKMHLPKAHAKKS